MPWMILPAIRAHATQPAPGDCIVITCDCHAITVPWMVLSAVRAHATQPAPGDYVIVT